MVSIAINKLHLVACLCSCILLLAASRLPAQTVQGTVTEAGQDRPVAGASVFVNSTTYGTACDAAGHFVLTQHPPFPFELTITAVGFESRVIQVTQAMAATSVAVYLTPKAIAIADIDIRPPLKDGWALYGKTFLEEFIGYSGFSKQCQLENKEALAFYYDDRERVLRVNATEPLRIRNLATGYLITYWLEDFSLDNKSRQLFFKGYSQFEPLRTRKRKKEAQWHANRLSAYRGSLCHFMRSVYRGRVAEEQFEVRTLKRVPQSQSGRYLPLSSDTFSTGDHAKLAQMGERILGSRPDVGKAMAFLMELGKWKADSSNAPLRLAGVPGPDTSMQQEYRFLKLTGDARIVVQHFVYPKKELPSLADAVALNRPPAVHSGLRLRYDTAGKPVLSLSPAGQGAEPDTALMRFAREKLGKQDPVLEILFTAIVPTDTFRKVTKEGQVQLYFKDCLQVTYTGETAEEAYYTRLPAAYKHGAENQQSILNLRSDEPLTLTPQGNFYDLYNLLVERYWAYEKLDKLLPLDYEPEAASRRHME